MRARDKETLLADARARLPAANRSLLDAADYIRKHGWHQGSYDNRVGAVCVLAAIIKVCQSSKAAHITAVLLQKSLRSDIPYWNDHVCRSREQAIQTLEEVGYESQPIFW